MKNKYKKNGGIQKKHLTYDQKISVLQKLGPKPSKLRIQAMAQQYNISSSTIVNWIEKGLYNSIQESYPQIQQYKVNNKYQANQKVQEKEGKQSKPTQTKIMTNEDTQNINDQIEIIL